MDKSARIRKFGKYGSAKYVYPKDTMTELRTWFESELRQRFPLPARLTGRSVQTPMSPCCPFTASI
jgi:hypothetical protein